MMMNPMQSGRPAPMSSQAAPANPGAQPPQSSQAASQTVSAGPMSTPANQQQGMPKLSEEQQNIATAIAETISAAMFNKQILSKSLQLAKSSQRPVPTVARIIAQIAVKSIDDVNEKVPVSKEAVASGLSRISKEFFDVLTQAGLAPEGNEKAYKAFFGEIMKAMYEYGQSTNRIGQKKQSPQMQKGAPQAGAMPGSMSGAATSAMAGGGLIGNALRG